MSFYNLETKVMDWLRTVFFSPASNSIILSEPSTENIFLKFETEKKESFVFSLNFCDYWEREDHCGSFLKLVHTLLISQFCNCNKNCNFTSTKNAPESLPLGFPILQYQLSLYKSCDPMIIYCDIIEMNKTKHKEGILT